MYKLYVLLVLSALISYFVVSLDKNNETTNEHLESILKTLPNKNRFWATNFSRTHTDGNQVKLNIKVDFLDRRQRLGKFIEFNNYDEIYVKGLILDQLLKSEILKFDMDEFGFLLLLKLNIDKNPSDQVETNVVLGNSLNRLVIEDLVFNFKPTGLNLQPIVLTANYAKVLLDTMAMRFEGNVHIKSESCVIQADIALWSNTENGFFFPNGYRLNKKLFSSPAFFQLTKAGRCNKVKLIKEIQYIDHLDQVENQLLKLMPPTAQLMFGFIGMPINQP